MARSSFKLKGMKKFIRNLDKEVQALKGRTHKGLVNAAIVLQRKAEPGTPIDVGNLRSSWFIVSYKTGIESEAPSFKGIDSAGMDKQHSNVTRHAVSAAKRLASSERPVIIFGYSANYAVFVHEAVDIKFNRPSAKSRWLFAAMQEARAEMLEEIRKHARF